MGPKGVQEVNAATPKVLGPCDGSSGFLGSMGVRFMVDGDESGGGFSLVEHPMSARALGAPMHRHAREDEYSYVIEGRVGALLGDHVLEAGPGSLIFKPRHQWHTFWNAGDTPARILEIISPAGFERYFSRTGRARWIQGCLSTSPEVPCRTILARGGPTKHSRAARALSIAHR